MNAINRTLVLETLGVRSGPSTVGFPFRREAKFIGLGIIIKLSYAGGSWWGVGSARSLLNHDELPLCTLLYFTLHCIWQSKISRTKRRPTRTGCCSWCCCCYCGGCHQQGRKKLAEVHTQSAWKPRKTSRNVYRWTTRQSNSKWQRALFLLLLRLLRSTLFFTPPTTCGNIKWR